MEDDDDQGAITLDPAALSIDQVWTLLHRDRFRRFLREYELGAGADPLTSKYAGLAVEIARHGYEGLTIKFGDIEEWAHGTTLAAFLNVNFLQVWRELDVEVDAFVKSVLEKYLTEADGGADAVELALLHESFTKKFHGVYETDFGPVHSIRQLRCEQIGAIIKLRGTVTRLSDVRPLLIRASFRCNVCGAMQHDVEQQHKLTMPMQCSNRLGETPCHNRVGWTLLPEFSQFHDWQKIRLQENSGEIPAGSMPRAIDAIVTRSLCDTCKPGDKVLLVGSLGAVPDVPSLLRPSEIPKSVAADRNRAARSESGWANNAISGLRKLGVAELAHKLVFFASAVHTNVQSTGDDVAFATAGDEDEARAAANTASVEQSFELLGLTRDERQLFTRIARAEDTLDRLVACFAPEVFGCESIKKGILLQLAGGVVKSTGAEGLRLRGDINVCIVGDPGTAKSQLLKYVKNFAPRAVYTSGITSSAAGLTVSVHRDREQGEGVIEAGALMLADNGICCIDEFEKMNIKDMVAIHEAVEQQTISICKGGIHAVLNARASILAACNPRNGRYDLALPFRHNVRLSAPIISRFDLFFALCDNNDFDRQVANHILNNHMYSHHAGVGAGAELTKKQLQLYLRVAKNRKPTLSPAAQRLLVDCYVELRAEASRPGAGRSAAVTVRSLESLIRLSEATAKLKFAHEVTEEHVRLAVRVVQTSLIRLRKVQVLFNDETTAEGDNGNCSMIDAEEYAIISSQIIEHFRDAEISLRSTTEGAMEEATAEKDELISWYVEQSTAADAEESEEVLMKKYETVSKVISLMVNRDMSLIEDFRTLGEGELAQRVTLLRLHPNFAADEVPDSTLGGHRRPPAHATMSTEFLAETLNRESGAASADQESCLLDDDDFMRQVYGAAAAAAPG